MEEITLDLCIVCGWLDCAVENHNCSPKTLQYIQKARETHGCRYSYEKTVFTRCKDAVTIICRDHGEFNQVIEKHIKGRGCQLCAGNNPVLAEEVFRQGISAQQGQVIGLYINSSTPIECICRNNHACHPRPMSIRAGQGMCRVCAKRDPESAELRFREKIEEQGGQVSGDWSGVGNPIDCICPKNHPCSPYPSSVLSGQGMCKTCSKRDPKIAEANFRKMITDQQGLVIGLYKNMNTRVECLCSNGHTCSVFPSNIYKGQGMCRVCRIGGKS